MGTFSETFELASGLDGPFETVEAVVDTGATYTVIPAPTLRRLGVEPMERQRFVLADGSRVELELGSAVIRIGERVRTTPVVFGEVGADSLLGAVTLEEFALGVDPLGQELVPVDGYLVGVRRGGGR